MNSRRKFFTKLFGGIAAAVAAPFIQKTTTKFKLANSCAIVNEWEYFPEAKIIEGYNLAAGLGNSPILDSSIAQLAQLTAISKTIKNHS